MLTSSKSPVSDGLLRVLGGLVILFFPALSNGQQLAREALSSFPADTHQVAYTNLAQLRSSPDYPQIRERLLNRQLRYFQDFLRSMAIDPDKDVDEVIFGWRGQPSDTTGLFGMAQGRFQPEQIRQYFIRSQLPSRQYAGFDLYAFGSGEDPADLFFTFLDSSLAAFGRLHDLKALLDVRSRTANALETNSSFVGWEAELEDTSPQWGILSGQAAANLAAPWLAGGRKLNVDLSAFMKPVQAVLYRVEWENGFSSHLAIVCKNPESASALATLLNLLRSAQQQGTADSGAAVASILQGVEAHQNGSRLELSASGLVAALDQVLRGGAADPAP